MFLQIKDLNFRISCAEIMICFSNFDSGAEIVKIVKAKLFVSNCEESLISYNKNCNFFVAY